MTLKILAAALLLGVSSFLVIRAIVNLPSKYERKPRALSSWNALDRGIDPTDIGEEE
jgi:hypothetical protein